jgi:AcrR family transcriptional regulator
MNDRCWQRARSSEQIEERVNEILEGAATVFLREPYEKVTMQMIAGEAGFTRSNLYRYFRTREEIFLALYISDINAWARRIQAAFSHEESLEDFVKKWTEVLYRQSRLLELTPLLSLTLEKNTSEEVYRRTKLALQELMGPAAAAIRKALPALSLDQVFGFLRTQQALLAGAWPMAQYSDMQLRVLDELDVPQLKFDFASLYENAVLMYLRGVITRST